MGNGDVRSHRHSLSLRSPGQPGLSRQVKREGDKLLPAFVNALSCRSLRVKATGEGRWGALGTGQGQESLWCPQNLSLNVSTQKRGGRSHHSLTILNFISPLSDMGI